jgi:hypothetical protein
MSEGAAQETTQGEQIAATITATCTGCETVQTHDVLGRGLEGQFLLKCQSCNSEDLYPLPEHAAALEAAYAAAEEDAQELTGTRDPREVGERIAAMVEDEAQRAEQETGHAETGPRVPPADPYTRTCPTCQGFGVTQTGSIVDGQEFRDCVDCRARGWQERLEREPQPQTNGEQEPQAADSWRWQ